MKPDVINIFVKPNPGKKKERTHNETPHATIRSLNFIMGCHEDWTECKRAIGNNLSPLCILEVIYIDICEETISSILLIKSSNFTNV